ncbi:MAG: T9SS type A sorting domain-containing protein [Saprospirales bacterium]|nr:T9SS type A sorting domain-containing protein [Saprospirales bacterium]
MIPLAVIYDVNGQAGQLFSATTLADKQLSLSQQNRKERILSLLQTESLQYVVVGDLPQIQHNGFLDLQIPGDTTTYTFAAEYVISDSTGDYTWAGSLVSPSPCTEDTTETDCMEGTLTMIRLNNSTAGVMHLHTAENTVYEIRNLGEGLNAWVKIRLDTFSGIDCTASGRYADTTASDVNSHCPVRVLAFYTDSAAAAYPDVLLTMHMAVAGMNHSLRRSHISENLLEIKLVGTLGIGSSDFTEQGEDHLEEDVLLLTSNNYILQKKAEYHADVVVVFTDDSYTDGNGFVAAFGDDSDDRDSAFAIVETGLAVSYFVFAHEMGHLFGARHERIPDDCGSRGDNSGLPHSHGETMRKTAPFYVWEGKTIMAVCNGTGTARTANYSNPNVKVKNQPTGNPATNFNAKTLAQAACRVSRYVVSEETTVYIVAPEAACPGDEVSVEAVISQASSPIQYFWQYSYDGFNYTPLNPSSSPSKYFQATIPQTLGESLWIRVSAGTSGGPFATATKRILAAESGFPPCDPHRPADTHHNAFTNEPEISLFPNPANAQIRLQVKDAENASFEVLIFNLFGQAVKRETGRFRDSRLEEIVIDITGLPAGYYLVRIQCADMRKTLHFTCIK